MDGLLGALVGAAAVALIFVFEARERSRAALDDAAAGLIEAIVGWSRTVDEYNAAVAMYRFAVADGQAAGTPPPPPMSSFETVRLASELLVMRARRKTDRAVTAYFRQAVYETTMTCPVDSLSAEMATYTRMIRAWRSGEWTHVRTTRALALMERRADAFADKRQPAASDALPLPYDRLPYPRG